MIKMAGRNGTTTLINYVLSSSLSEISRIEPRILQENNFRPLTSKRPTEFISWPKFMKLVPKRPESSYFNMIYEARPKRIISIGVMR
jgi:hypothetical protein